MIGWLKGAHKSREAAEQALTWVAGRLKDDEDPEGIDGERLVFPREGKAAGARAASRRLSRFLDLPDAYVKGRMCRSALPVGTSRRPTTVTAILSPAPKTRCHFPTTPSGWISNSNYIVIGKKGSNLTFEEATDHIAGYTIPIDPSCRDGYKREPFGSNKRKDFCTPMGPCLVTADGINERDIDCRIIVDGETWWEGNMGELGVLSGPNISSPMFRTMRPFSPAISSALAPLAWAVPWTSSANGLRSTSR